MGILSNIQPPYSERGRHNICGDISIHTTLPCTITPYNATFIFEVGGLS